MIYVNLFSIDTDKTGISIGKFLIKFSTIENIINECIKIVIILFLMYLVIKVGNKIIDKFVKNQEESNKKFSMDDQKAKTIGGVLKSVLKYMTYFIGAALIFSDMFKGVSVALASVGGFALGFGAQSLVKDVINGFFILFEDQYGVGDYITIGKFSGIVETIGIRTTVIKDLNGDVHLIPNGSITEVTNHSKGNIRFLVDIEISYKEDINKAIDVITKECKVFEKENEDVVEPIEVWGVISLNAYSITIRVAGKSKPLSQWKMERDLRKRLKEAIDKAGIEIPYPKTEIINKSE
ncbi:MAG: mechanosensitive ion channel family protein [Clostridium sp.]